MNKFIIYSFLYIMNGFCIRICCKFCTCLCIVSNPTTGSNLTRATKMIEKNYYIAPWLQNTPSEKLCISLSSNSCSHFYLFFKSFLLSNPIIFKLPFTFFKIPRSLLKSTPRRAPHAKHLQQTRNLPHHISCKVTSTRYILWVTKRAFLIFPLYT
jgi:hypothetical protein